MWHKKKTAVAAVALKPVYEVRISAEYYCPVLSKAFGLKSPGLINEIADSNV